MAATFLLYMGGLIAMLLIVLMTAYAMPGVYAQTTIWRILSALLFWPVVLPWHLVRAMLNPTDLP